MVAGVGHSTWRDTPLPSCPRTQHTELGRMHIIYYH